MKELRKIPSDCWKASGGTVNILMANPGGGKTFLLSHILNNYKDWINWSSLPPPRQLVISSGGADKLEYKKDVTRCFKTTKEMKNVFMEEPKLENLVSGYNSTVLVCDDTIITSEKFLRGLVSFLFADLRHKKLLLFISLHSIMYIPTIQSLVKLSTGIFLLPSSSNLSCIKRLSQWFAWNKQQEANLSEEFQKTVQLKIESNIYDPFLIIVPLSICITKVVTCPLHEEKNALSKLNRIFDLVSEMTTKYYYLVPEEQLCDITDLCKDDDVSERDRFVGLFSKLTHKEKLGEFFKALETLKGIRIDYREGALSVGDVAINLMDLSNIIIGRRTKHSRKAQQVFRQLEKRGLRLPEVNPIFCYRPYVQFQTLHFYSLSETSTRHDILHPPLYRQKLSTRLLIK